MRAMAIDHLGADSEPRLVERPEPTAAEGGAVIRMVAASVNQLDNLVRLGATPGIKEPPLVLGFEGAGVVQTSGIPGLPVGTRVFLIDGAFGVSKDGTWQDYVTVTQPRSLVPIPANLGDVEAAAVPEAYLTAQAALSAGGFQGGQTLLVPAVGGSVGNAAVQLARAQGAARVITSAGTAAKAEHAQALGYVDVIDLSRETLHEGVARLTEGGGVDLALDSVGGALTGQALAALRAGGTLVCIGFTGGEEAAFDIPNLVRKRLRVVGFGLTPPAVVEAYGTILPLLTQGRVTPVIARTFPLVEAAAAQRYLREERPFGKVVLTH